MGGCLSAAAEVIVADSGSAQQPAQQPAPPQPAAKSQPHQSLINVAPGDVPDVLFADVLTTVKIYDVHDGDTVNFIAMAGNTPVKLALRLLGIDTPEVRAAKDRLPEEKIAGAMARDRLAGLIGQLPALATVRVHDWDKFGGRVLGDIILADGRSAADVLIAEGYGRRYNGEKKQPWLRADFAAAPFNIR